MTLHQVRNKDRGVAGNPGQFAALAPKLESSVSLGDGKTSLSNSPSKPVVDVPEGIFDAGDVNTDWAKEPIRRGALRRFNLSEDDYEKALSLMNDNAGGWQKARKAFSMTDDELKILTSTDRDMRDSKTPYFLNGGGTRNHWALLTASGLGDVPLMRGPGASTYVVPPPVGRNDLITVTEGGHLEFTDAAGSTQITDGAGIHRIFDQRRGIGTDNISTGHPEPVMVRTNREPRPHVPRTPPPVQEQKKGWAARLANKLLDL